MAGYDALLQPFRLRHLLIRNRIMSTAHANGYPEDGMPTERYRLYQEEKAKGGIGLTMFGGSSAVSPDCRAAFGQVSVAGDAVIPHFRALSDAVHRHGAAIMCQIGHMGRRSRWDFANWLPPVAPSRVREPEHRAFPKAMEDWDFRRIRRDFAEGARRCRDGGLDGVELSFSGTHLVPQFWSPLTNKRTDDYGGSLENRMRFSLEVLEAAREAVGPDYVLGVRITGDELLEGGLSAEECLEIAVRLARTGMIDFLNVLHSSTSDYRVLGILMPNMAFPPAPFLYLASAIRAAVDVPVFHAGRINDFATAARAVEEGHVDLVAMTRAHMADPHLVGKLREGRADEVRQCVGANYCVDRVMGADALCIQNAATGRESMLPHVVPKAARARRAVVVGAGVAGLEAARVLAARGHRVTLFEKEARTGGQVNLAARAGWREGLSGVVRWLDAEVRRQGVDLRLGRAAEAADVLAEEPEVVVVATGGGPDKGPIEGAAHAASTWDLLSGRVEPAESVLLFDDEGGHAGMSCAELMAARGARVELVHPERFTGVEVGPTNWGTHLRELYRLGVVMTPDLRLLRIEKEGNRLLCVLRNEYTVQEEERLVDQVVAEHGTAPDDRLYFELKPLSANGGEVDLEALLAVRPQEVANNPGGRFRLYRVGDAVAHRNIHAAILDSLRLCVAV